MATATHAAGYTVDETGAFDEAALRVERARNTAALLCLNESNANKGDCELASHHVTASVAGTVERLCQDADSLLKHEIDQQMSERKEYPQKVKYASG